MNEFRRLLGYTRPYRGRLAAALVAMVFYGLATFFLAKLIKDIVDDVLVRQDRVYEVMTVLVIVYLVKGVGAYLSVRFLVRYFRTRTLTPFTIYCIVVGLASVVYLGLTG